MKRTFFNKEELKNNIESVMTIPVNE